ncbi:MAG TPA: M15 family metallopeptidase [Mycobacterium sp.]|jgi:hypothetical protein|nr:M15 family metallopeptidase [Mycobacterium sp.]HPZ95698.1 M15 family metallopeptidase [Mycobacterium sp.]HQE14908.1 M15 family metallopeptidase [Mycobacterium sp.]
MVARVVVLMAATLMAGCATGVSTAVQDAPIAPTPAPAPSVSAPKAVPATPHSRPAVVHPVTAADLGASWRPECPVPPADLRRVEVDHLGYDGVIRRGNLVVHRDVVGDVIAIFADLARMRYPIERMRTVEQYPGAEDEASMRDNNTSAFNCRPLPGSARWSEHAYGRAIDVNPLVNPYLDAAGDLQPTTAGRYLDRTRDDLGLLHPGDAAVAAFTDRGWTWGGTWRDPVDYQHFEVG